jgi:hypothetical protein
MRDRKTLFVYKWDYDPNFISGNGKREVLKKPPAADIYPCAPVWLGETEVGMTKKLGSPKIEKDVRVYRDHGVQIRATFDKGVCSRIIYISDEGKKFTDHWVSATLGLNSGGSAWLVFEDSTPKKSFFNTYNDKFYARLENGKNLGIMTSAVYKHSAQKLNDTKQVPNQKSK